MNFKNQEKLRQLTLGAIGFIAACFVVNSVKADTTVQDHYKNVIQKKPYSVEVCYQGSGDKTGDTLLGAIIGGAIGQNITKDLPNGNICRTETRYNEESRTVYSHSTITFVYEGKQYKLNFKK